MVFWVFLVQASFFASLQFQCRVHMRNVVCFLFAKDKLDPVVAESMHTKASNFKISIAVCNVLPVEITVIFGPPNNKITGHLLSFFAHLLLFCLPPFLASFGSSFAISFAFSHPLFLLFQPFYQPLFPLSSCITIPSRSGGGNEAQRLGQAGRILCSVALARTAPVGLKADEAFRLCCFARCRGTEQRPAVLFWCARRRQVSLQKHGILKKKNGSIPSTEQRNAIFLESWSSAVCHHLASKNTAAKQDTARQSSTKLARKKTTVCSCERPRP